MKEKLVGETIQQRVYYVVVMCDPRYRNSRFRDTFIGYTGPANETLVQMPATVATVRDGIPHAYRHTDELRARTVLDRAKQQIDTYRRTHMLPLTTFKIQRVVTQATFRAVR